ncbi:DMT family transporter [Pseudoruegeria sp. HB172150]|uniref:DMT family transporter n=1 Tax=Pseudoruegeria sp. HB172150 TaxID=2721164 RepID=UPI0015542175|nr:DMT family transporter [Pseudoruegeria sp. HB172150]
MNAQNTLRAAAWMIGAIVSFTSMAIAGRALAGQHDTFEIMTYRSLVGIAIVLAVGWRAGTLQQITRRSLHIHFIRNISHFIGQNLWFFAIASAPLAQVFALEFTSPLWVTVLAPLVLKERLTSTRALAAALGFVGILFVARPFGGLSLGPGLIAAALAAIGFAGSAIFTRLLTRTETITCILFYLTLMQAAFGLICAAHDGAVTLPTAATLPWLILVGCAGLVAHFCLTTALSLAPASVVMPIDFARLPIIAIVGMVLYAEPLDPAILAGAAVIFAANWMNIRKETRASASW